VLTALVLQLIQCVLSLPDKLGATGTATPAQPGKGESAALSEIRPAVVVATINAPSSGDYKSKKHKKKQKRRGEKELPSKDVVSNPRENPGEFL
jgi:hypothetical protein